MDEPTPINLGTGSEIKVKQLVKFIAELSGFNGRIEWDETKPDSQPRRCLDVQRVEALLGWRAVVNLRDGLKQTIDWYRAQETLGEVQSE